MTRTCVAMGAMALAMFAGSAYAGDQNPPGAGNPLAPWTRGAAGTTYNLWFFHTNSPVPDQSITNPTIASGTISNPDGSIWQPDDGNGRGDGVWCLQPGGGFMDFTIPNYNDTHSKTVYIQLKYLFNASIPGISVFDPNNGNLAAVPGGGSGPTGLGGGIFYLSEALTFSYCPLSEIVHIVNTSASNPLYIDQLVVDTNCTPAPGAAALLGLGGLMATRRRRR